MTISQLFLHINYCLPFKEWQARGVKRQKMVKDRRKHFQEEFRSKMELLVDFPNPKGGILMMEAWRAGFLNLINNPLRSSKLTLRFSAASPYSSAPPSRVLRSLTLRLRTTPCRRQGLMQNCRAGALVGLFLSLHKLLIHTTKITKGLMLPKGLLSVETQESRNKDFSAVVILVVWGFRRPMKM